MNPDPQSLPAGTENVDATGAAVMDIASSAQLQAVRYALSRVRKHIGKQPVGCQGEGAANAQLVAPKGAFSAHCELTAAFLRMVSVRTKDVFTSTARDSNTR